MRDFQQFYEFFKQYIKGNKFNPRFLGIGDYDGFFNYKPSYIESRSYEDLMTNFFNDIHTGMTAII